MTVTARRFQTGSRVFNLFPFQSLPVKKKHCFSGTGRGSWENGGAQG